MDIQDYYIIKYWRNCDVFHGCTFGYPMEIKPKQYGEVRYVNLNLMNNV